MTPMKTISPDGIVLTRLALLGLAALLAGCQVEASPPCPGFGRTEQAPSAGCLAIRDGKVLVVQDLQGRLSPPGGSAESGESAQCAAFRETWEETGLLLEPDRLLEVFDTGFHLYLCQHHDASGKVDPPPRLEVQNAFYLHPEEFGAWPWRFPGQETVLKRLAEENLSR